MKLETLDIENILAIFATLEPDTYERACLYEAVTRLKRIEGICQGLAMIDPEVAHEIRLLSSGAKT